MILNAWLHPGLLLSSVACGVWPVIFQGNVTAAALLWGSATAAEAELLPFVAQAATRFRQARTDDSKAETEDETAVRCWCIYGLFFI